MIIVKINPTFTIIKKKKFRYKKHFTCKHFLHFNPFLGHQFDRTIFRRRNGTLDFDDCLSFHLVHSIFGIPSEFGNLFLCLTFNFIERSILLLLEGVAMNRCGLNASLLQYGYGPFCFVHHGRYAIEHCVNIFPFFFAAQAIVCGWGGPALCFWAHSWANVTIVSITCILWKEMIRKFLESLRRGWIYLVQDKWFNVCGRCNATDGTGLIIEQWLMDGEQMTGWANH